jgi:hypothetical protein
VIKTLLFAFIAFGAHLTVNAQNTISFEESEGYTLGTLSGQNGWIVTDGGDANAPNVTNVVVSNELGTNVMRFPITTSDDPSELWASKLISPGTNTFSITQKVYAEGRDADVNGSDMVIGSSALVNGERVLTSGIDFSYDGKKYLLSSYTATDHLYHFQTEVGDYDANTWYIVKLIFDLNANTVTYYVNDQNVGSTGLFMGGGVDAITYKHDALTTSHYIDDITVTPGTAGLNNQAVASFTVSPNPSSSIINIESSNNAIVNSIAVTDLNGRVVKSVEFAGVSKSQVNVTDLSAGIYMLNISSDKGVTTKKIIKN